MPTADIYIVASALAPVAARIVLAELAASMAESNPPVNPPRQRGTAVVGVGQPVRSSGAIVRTSTALPRVARACNIEWLPACSASIHRLTATVTPQNTPVRAPVSLASLGSGVSSVIRPVPGEAAPAEAQP